jgi:NAD(P)-dependent dehydrogenase (short-subunit alcohol dehydrogenase family)
MNELRFDGRVAVISGGGRGLGREYALLLAARGATVVVNDPGVSLRGDGFDAGPASEVVSQIRAAGGEALVSTASVATDQGCAELIGEALGAFGKIDILIHNAGNTRHAPLRELSEADFDAVIDVHFKGGFNLVRRVIGPMCDANYGRIVLTSSVGGLYGNHGVVSYAMAKAGVIGLCNVAALEGADHNVKCNLIVPGAVTRIAEGADARGFPMAFEDFPLTMKPPMIAPPVAWMAHDTCSISGEMLVAIGGRVARGFIGETVGHYRPHWSIEDVAENIEVIRDARDPWILPVVPHGHSDHIARSFAMGMPAEKEGEPGR